MKEFFVKNKEIIIILAIVLICLIILLPIICTCKYIHSYADDYMYGIETHKTWQETHSIIEVIKTATSKTAEIYETWQGSFCAVFLMTLQPAIFGEQYYFITTIILLGSFIFANFYFMKIALKDYLKTSNLMYVGLTSVLVTLSIAFVPYPRESIFWFNGSIYYTFFYSIMLILFGTILKLFKEEKKSKRIVLLIISAILAILVGGSNYSTALISNIILAVILFLLIIKKDKKNSLFVSIILLICLASLLISARAPGNAVRQATETNGLDVNASIEVSFKYAIKYIIKRLNYSSICFYLLLIPIFKKVNKELPYKFKFPYLFTALTFCIYSAQYTPPLYAMGKGTIPPRLANIIFYLSFLLIAINIWYWTGYHINKKGFKSNSKLFLIILIIGCIGFFADYKNSNIYYAMENFKTGVIYEYDSQMKNRLEVYNNDEIKNVEIKKLTAIPFLIKPADLGEDTEKWGNKIVADFFGKESVKAID